MDDDGCALEAGERVLEQALNRLASRLTLPPDETGPIVCKRKLQVTDYGRSGLADEHRSRLATQA